MFSANILTLSPNTRGISVPSPCFLSRFTVPEGSAPVASWPHGIKRLRGYLWGTKFRIFSDHKALESIEKVGDHNARVQRWLEFLTAFDYTLEYRKGSANGNADFLSRLPEPATEHDRSGSTRLTPVDDDGIYLIRACGLRTGSSPVPGVGLSGLVPNPDSAVLGGLPFASSDFRDFRVHGPRMRIDDLSAPSVSFVARVSASVTTADCRLGRGATFPAADSAFASVFAIPSEDGQDSAEVLAAATAVAQPAPFPTSTPQGADSVAIPDPTASAPPPPGIPTLPTTLPPSGRISTRTRRKTAVASGATPSAVDYGFGPGGAFRPSAGRTNTPPRVPRPRPPLAVATATAPAASLVPTVPIPSDVDHAEPVGTPLLRLPSQSDIPSASTADLDALGAAAELQFGDSAARYSHTDWEREQQAEPACHAAMRYIILGRPPALPAGFLSSFPSHQRPSFAEIQELAGKGRLHTTEDGIVLLVRNPSPPPLPGSERPVGRAACLLNDEPVRIYVPLTTHAPLGHAGLPFHGFLPPRHRAHATHARTVLLVGWDEHLHPVVASPLPEVPSTENLAADGPLARHLDAPARRTRNCRQRRLFRPPSGHAQR